jgi:hypothetical protein
LRVNYQRKFIIHENFRTRSRRDKHGFATHGEVPSMELNYQRKFIVHNDYQKMQQSHKKRGTSNMAPLYNIFSVVSYFAASSLQA